MNQDRYCRVAYESVGDEANEKKRNVKRFMKFTRNPSAMVRMRYVM